MYAGFSLGGEHLIANQLTARYCTYPYIFNIYNNAAGGHPITLINCCDELCTHGPYFANDSYENTITLIDYNMEITLLGTWARVVGAEEGTPGQTRGTITYSISDADNLYAKSDTIRFWKDAGNGYAMIARNTHHKIKGSTAERPPNPNAFQRYIDTTLSTSGKEILYHGGSWRDSAGTVV